MGSPGKRSGTPAFARPPKVWFSRWWWVCLRLPGEKRTKKKNPPVSHTSPIAAPGEADRWEQQVRDRPSAPGELGSALEPGPAPPPAPYLPRPSRAPLRRPLLTRPPSLPHPALTLSSAGLPLPPPDRRRLSSLGNIPPQTRASSYRPRPPHHTHTHRNTHRPSPRTTTLTVSPWPQNGAHR